MPFFSKNFLQSPSTKQNSALTYAYSAIVTGPPSFAVLAISGHAPSVAVAAESFLDVLFAPFIGIRVQDVSKFANGDAQEYLKWRFALATYMIEPSTAATIDKELYHKSRLATARINALNKVITNINVIRTKLKLGIDFQTEVYLLKKQQAAAFKASGYDESMLLEIPFVVQYADFAGISLKMAADDILFKANLDEAFLAKTELLRLKYFKLIKFETDLNRFSEITDSFQNDCHAKQLV